MLVCERRRFGPVGGASLIGADLTCADLAGASLVGADLSGVDMSGASLMGANLSRADLSDEYPPRLS